MFQTKVVWFEEEHKKVPLIWPWVALLRSDQGHIDFIKRNTIFFIPVYPVISDSKSFSKHYNEVHFY